MAWLAAAQKNVHSKRDARLLTRACSVLRHNILRQGGGRRGDQPWHPRRGICPSLHNYRGIWNWDAAFHAVAVSRWDPELAREQASIFLDTQLSSGALIDVWLESGSKAITHGKPPVFPWAVAVVDSRNPDAAFLRRAYRHFVRYEEYWRRRRGGDAEGLFHYASTIRKPKRLREERTRFESGWDNSVRWDSGAERLWPIDLNCYMVMLYRAMGYMARRLGRRGDVATWRRLEEELAVRLEETLWDPKRSCYVDVDRRTGAPSPVLSPASFMPLFVGTAPRSRAASMAALAADPRRFFPGMPTVSYNDSRYESGLYWRGPCWLNTAYFALKGLVQYGHAAVARRSRETILGWCDGSPDAIYEYYDSKNGQGLGAPHFGWSAAFLIELILNFGAESFTPSA